MVLAVRAVTTAATLCADSDDVTDFDVLHFLADLNGFANNCRCQRKEYGSKIVCLE